MITVGIPRSLLYYYDKDLWINFFNNLNIKTIISPKTNKQILENGNKLSNDEACLSLKLYLGHINELIDKCNYILVPRLYSIKKKEQVCTNYNCLYDLVNNTFNKELLNYDIDLYKNKSEVLAYLKLGEQLGFSYIKSYDAYKKAKQKQRLIRKDKEEKQIDNLLTNKKKILLAGHPYNLYDDLVGIPISKYLKSKDIEVIYSDKIPSKLINTESNKLSTDLNWTHSKEVMASINYYKDKVNGIILLSSFPCGPDSLTNELILHKVNIPLLTLVFEDLNSDIGITTRLESFLDILKNKEEKIYAKYY